MKFASIATLVLILCCSGCTSFVKNDCPSIAEEPVSGCRARLRCQLRKKTSYSVGLRSAAQTRENYGVDMGQSSVTDNYLDCVSRDLDEQRATFLITEGNIYEKRAEKVE